MFTNAFFFAILLIGVDKLVGWALSHHFMHCSNASVRDSKLLISGERLLFSSLIVLVNNFTYATNLVDLSMFFY